MNRRGLRAFARNTAGRRVVAVLFLLSSPLLTRAVQIHDEWIKYTSPEGRYSVLVPSQPTVDSQEATSASGEKFTQYKATVVSAGVVYIIGYFDYSAPTIFTFDKARDGMVEAVQGTLLSERSISLGGSPGRELRLSAKDSSGAEYLMLARFYDIDRRVYVLQFITAKSPETEFESRANRYFDSFQALKTP
jgi:hypothetical protein